MTFTDIYAREMHRMSREQLLRNLLRERYGWAPRAVRIATDNDDEGAAA